MKPGLGQDQAGPLDDLGGQEPEEAVELAPVLAIEHCMHLRLDQARRSRLVTGMEGMDDGFVHQPLPRKPRPGAGVDCLDLGRRGILGEPDTQQGLEEMVVTKPGALFVQGDDKEVGAADGADKGFAVKSSVPASPGARQPPFVLSLGSIDRRIDQLIEQRGTEAVKKRGPEQMVALGRGQPPQHFGQQVFRDVSWPCWAILRAKAAGSGWPRKESAASCRPTAQPSVLSSSRAAVSLSISGDSAGQAAVGAAAGSPRS